MATRAAKRDRRRVAIYARVSTPEQTTANQLAQLRAWAKRCGHVLVGEYVDDGISGAKGRDKRPEFDRLLKNAVRREFDIVAAWSVDRLGRSLIDLLHFLRDLEAHGVDLFLHQQALDTTTPAGKALFEMCGVFAQFERSIIVERVNAGIARVRREGTKSGRPIGRPRMEDAEKVRRIRALRKQGLGILKIAKQVRVGTATVYRVLDTHPA